MDTKARIGQKVRELRERAGLSQTHVAQAMGLDKHQIISSIETGERQLKVSELAELARVLSVDPQEILSVSIDDKPAVLWRSRPTENVGVEEARIVKRCKDYQLVETLLEDNPRVNMTLPRRPVDLDSFEFRDAYQMAEMIRSDLGLGRYPAEVLRQALETHGVRFLMLNESLGSAATSVSPKFGTFIFLNPREVPWRRQFSLAHELFHVLTWNESMLVQVQSDEKLWEKNEKLADAFAAGLLMPSETVKADLHQITNEGRITFAALLGLARQFKVSTAAFLWRLAYLGIFKRSSVEELLKDETFKSLDKESHERGDSDWAELSERFTRMAYFAYVQGKISRGRLAELVEVPLVDLSEFLACRGLAEANYETIEVSHL